MGNPSLGITSRDQVKLTPGGERLYPLPEAENEVKSLTPLYGAALSKVYIGAEAREGVLKAQAPNFMILHLATHGILNDSRPMYSQLVLSQDSDERSEDGLLDMGTMS